MNPIMSSSNPSLWLFLLDSIPPLNITYQPSKQVSHLDAPIPGHRLRAPRCCHANKIIHSVPRLRALVGSFYHTHNDAICAGVSETAMVGPCCVCSNRQNSHALGSDCMRSNCQHGHASQTCAIRRTCAMHVHHAKRGSPVCARDRVLVRPRVAVHLGEHGAVYITTAPPTALGRPQTTLDRRSGQRANPFRRRTCRRRRRRCRRPRRRCAVAS